MGADRKKDLDTGRCRQGWCQNVQEAYHCTSDRCDGWNSVGDGSCQPIFAPRAFSSIKQDLKRLPPCISWSASKKGWMTSDIFHTFLVKVNENFRVSNRNCVLFLDNFSGHKAGVDRCSINDLSNTRIEWLPANCTSICQPIDMGIVQAFKLRYRKFLHEHMCNQVFADRPPTTGLDLLRVCMWLSKAWNSLNSTQTVRRCFAKAGFIMPGEELMSTEETTENPGTDEGDLLAAEAEIADPPMVEDHEQILNEVLVSSQARDVTVPDEEDGVVVYDNEAVPVLTARLPPRPSSTWRASFRLRESQPTLNGAQCTLARSGRWPTSSTSSQRSASSSPRISVGCVAEAD